MTEEHKHIIDAASPILAFGSAMAELSTVLTIILTVMAIAWYCVRFHDRFGRK